MTPGPDRPIDRRPIAARSWSVLQRLASWLARSGASPNAISVGGMLFGLSAGALLAATARLPEGPARACFLAGAACIQVRLLANMLDGMVAVESGRVSAVGELYNEIPDRISDVATLVGAGYAAGGSVPLGYLAACVAVFTAYVRAVGKGAGLPQDFRGPLAKQQRMFVVTLSALFCAFAPVSWQLRRGLAVIDGIPSIGLTVVVLGGTVTAGRRLFGIASALKEQARTKGTAGTKD